MGTGPGSGRPVQTLASSGHVSGGSCRPVTGFISPRPTLSVSRLAARLASPCRDSRGSRFYKISLLAKWFFSSSYPSSNMPRYYCDYCDTYLTHDSPSVRKQHNAGYKHKANVRTYYQQFEEQQTQSLIDQKVKEHLVGQTTYQQQVGVAFNQHLASLPSALPRPRLPVLPPPVIPVGASAQAHPNAPLMPGIRPPVFPRLSPGPPGYPMAPVVMPPGASAVSMQPNGLPRPPASLIVSSAPGALSLPSNGAPPGSIPGGYLVNATTIGSASSGTPTSLSQASAASSLPSHVYAAAPQPQGLPRVNPGGAGPPTSFSSQDGYGYGQASDSSHLNPAY